MNRKPLPKNAVKRARRSRYPPRPQPLLPFLMKLKPKTLRELYPHVYDP